MFKLDACVVVAYLGHGVERASGLVARLTGGIRVTSPLLAVYLDRCGDHKFTLVSAFALRAFAIAAGPAVVLKMTFELLDNPVLAVFAFEAFILTSLSTCQLTFEERDGSRDPWNPWEGGIVRIFDPTVDASELVLQPHWNVPSAWIQGCYDAVIRKKSAADSAKMSLVFVLMTPSKQQLKPEPFIELLAKVRAAFPLEPVSDVELRYVVPLQVLKTFEVPVSASDFQRQVVDVACGSTGSAATDGGASGAMPEINCTRGVVGVEYPHFHLVEDLWRD